MTSPARAKRARLAFAFGIEPVTTLTFTSSSFAPCPNALSFLGSATSWPTDRFGALSQSWFPAVLTTRLPSLPSNVLPARFALEAATKTTAKSARAVSVSPVVQSRRVRRLRK